MRVYKCLVFFISLALMAVTFGCGGNGGGDGGGSSTGIVSMSITDAKPLLPEPSQKEITNVFITIDEVLVHKSGGGWVEMGLPQSPTPFTIDLLQYSTGNTTELVPPVAIESGKYTQIRLSVTNAFMIIHDLISDTTEDVPITIPSENLKTDKNFDFTVPVNEDGTGNENTAVDITIDFDLSKSIVVEGPVGNESYKLKPVLHIVETTEAATIEGFVANSRFVGSYVVITVFDSNEQEYTKVKVEKTTSDADNNPLDETSYEIFWLVPNQAYTIKISHDPTIDDDLITDGIQYRYNESADVPSVPDPLYPDGTLPPGARYPLDFPPIP